MWFGLSLPRRPAGAQRRGRREDPRFPDRPDPTLLGSLVSTHRRHSPCLSLSRWSARCHHPAESQCLDLQPFPPPPDGVAHARYRGEGAVCAAGLCVVPPSPR